MDLSGDESEQWCGVGACVIASAPLLLILCRR